MTSVMLTSQFSGFYRKSQQERLAILTEWADLTPEDQAALTSGGLTLDAADHMIENVIGTYALPMGIATNFLINTKDYLIPMVVEEPSIVAACSFAAKLAREGGGFTTSSDEPIMIGQIQITGVDDVYVAASRVHARRAEILERANDPTSSIVKRGGGAVDLELRPFPNDDMLIVHLLYDCRDAMGANAVNTACEALAPFLAEITGGKVNLRILSNLSDRRKARASCMIPLTALKTDSATGAEVAAAIVNAARFAEIDPYRAATHNKGVMNGIDAVCIATGNDWRALEAGAHAYSVRDGHYTSMTRWIQADNGHLHGSIEIPLAIGTVGGATRVHPGARAAMKILDVQSARELAEVMAAVGLAQNFSAIRALATDGIQKGHMALHARQIAAAAGASTDQIAGIVEQLLREGNIRLERAKELIAATESRPQ